MQPLSPVALTRQDLGTCLDIETAPQPLGPFGSHGPGSSDDNRNTRRRLDAFSSPEDEHARSAVLLRFPCEQHHTGITKWINNLWENRTFHPLTNPSEFIAKQVPCQPDSYSKQEPSVRTLWPDVKKVVSPLKLTVLSATQKTVISIPQSNSLEDWEIGKQFVPLWRVLAQQFKILFPGW